MGANSGGRLTSMALSISSSSNKLDKIVSELAIPFRQRRFRVSLAVGLDHPPVQRRIERKARALRHQHVIIIDGEVVSPFRVQQSDLAVGRRNANQHPVGRRQRRQDGAIGLNVWIG